MFSTGEFRIKERFISGLKNLLITYPSDYSSRVLVLSNAIINREARGEFPESSLSRAFAQCISLNRETEKGRTHPAMDESDRRIFEVFERGGMISFKCTEIPMEEGFIKHFNAVRGFRPKRFAGTPLYSIFQPFDKSFNFLLPYLENNCLWDGIVDLKPAKAFYNKYPFAPFHFLLFPEIHRRHPQVLTREIHHAVFAAIGESGLPDLCMGYNSAGAFTSINHLHFQVILGKEAFPVTNPRWTINGGSDLYPAYCSIFSDSRSSWEWISRLHARNTAYNLLYTAGTVYGFARAMQGHYESSPGMPDFGFSELCGRLVFTDREACEQATYDEIRSEFAKVSLNIL